MTAPLDPRQVNRLRELVARRLGLHFDDGNLDRLLVVATACAEAAPSFDAWLARLDAPDRGELRDLAERLTVGETYFFRNANDLRAFSGHVLPERMRARAGVRRLRLLSAGCSSGEEPYTLAMLARDERGLDGWDVRVLGVDVNPAAIERAAAARYGQWSLRQTPDAMRDRFFVGGPREYGLAPEVRALVEVREANLVEEDAALWAPGSWDVVFCRNVLMYFGADVVRRVVARIAGSLAPGGFLFLGHAETLRGVSTAFHLRHSHDTFYYQVRGPGEREAPGPPPAAAAVAPPSPAVAAAALAAGGDWLDAIHAASERVARLAAEAARSPPAPATSPPRAAADPLRIAAAVELVRRERYADALAALGPEEGADPDLLLVRAVILASSGDPPAAERVCARILEVDELNAEAHYVLALCREHAGDRGAAANHDHYALYLDPTFAMPRLHLGLLAKRAGDAESARRELSRALALLAGEDGPRLLLLGGGFGRDALLDLCRAELRACGGLA